MVVMMVVVLVVMVMEMVMEMLVMAGGGFWFTGRKLCGLGTWHQKSKWPDRPRGRPRSRSKTQPGVEWDHWKSLHSPGEVKCAGGFAPVGHFQTGDEPSQQQVEDENRCVW